MTETIREVPLSGPVPRLEVPGWRQRYGVVAGITARGDAEGFDLGLRGDAPVGDVMARWQEFRNIEPGFPGVVLGHQVHRTEVRWHAGLDGWLLLDGVDGHGTAAAGLLLCVTVADCVPVYLLAPAQRAVTLLHAGWRGASAGILGCGIRRLTEATGAAPEELVMHCGPSICGTCYEVGSEVMDAFQLPCSGSGPWRVDLAEQLAGQAAEWGLDGVTRSAWCPGCEPRRLHSHRASGGRAGRQIAYLGYPVLGH